jgi:hypothetical protein
MGDLAGPPTNNERAFMTAKPNAAPNEGEFRPAAEPARPSRGRSLLFQLAAVGLIVVSALAGTGLARLLKGPPKADNEEVPTALGLRLPEKLEEAFRGWGPRKPDVVLLLSGEEHGYVMPCGCSDPQMGGLERRYNLLRLLKARGWQVAAVDLGNVAQKEGIRGLVKLPNLQGMAKYVASMKALKAMGYTAVGLGEYEAALTFADVLANFALNEERPRVVAANIDDAANLFPQQLQSWVPAIEVDAPRPGTLPIPVGVTGVIGRGLRDKIRETNVKFTEASRALVQVLQEMDGAGVELRVLLYQGQINGAPPGAAPTEGVACAKAFPQFQVLLCLSDTDLPPALPLEVDHADKGIAAKTQIISLGHKAKSVGVLGVWRTGKKDPAFEFKYQLVELTPEFKTPKGQEKGHLVLDLMEDYTRTLKANDYLGRYPQTKHDLQAHSPVKGLRFPGGPNEPTYVGSQRCKQCHPHAFAVWEKTPHSHAYKTLVEEAKRPSNRQFDGECVVCHTVGFGYQGGFKDAQKTPLLENVGCESCHGPASLHVKNPSNPEWQKRMNLAWWKDPAGPPLPAAAAKKRLDAIDVFCQKCHDIDNDVTWTHGAFERKWKLVEHPTPAPAD